MGFRLIGSDYDFDSFVWVLIRISIDERLVGLVYRMIKAYLSMTQDESN